MKIHCQGQLSPSPSPFKKRKIGENDVTYNHDIELCTFQTSQMCVEMQIENNKMREEMEAAKFELTNKVKK